MTHATRTGIAKGSATRAKHTREELENEANSIFVSMEDQHDVHIKFVRKYRGVIRRPEIVQEIKAIAAIFYSLDTVHCHWCESGAMLDDTTSWDVDRDEDDVLFDMSVCRIFGCPGDEHEKCLNTQDMDDLSRIGVDHPDEDPIKLRDLLLRVHRIATKSVISSMTNPPFCPSPTVLSMARDLDEHVRTSRIISKKMKDILNFLAELDGLGKGAVADSNTTGDKLVHEDSDVNSKVVQVSIMHTLSEVEKEHIAAKLSQSGNWKLTPPHQALLDEHVGSVAEYNSAVAEYNSAVERFESLACGMDTLSIIVATATLKGLAVADLRDNAYLFRNFLNTPPSHMEEFVTTCFANYCNDIEFMIKFSRPGATYEE